MNSSNEGEPATKKQRVTPSKVIDKVIASILALGQPSSAVAVHKYCKEMWGYDNIKTIRKLFKERGDGALEAVTAHKCWVTGVERNPEPVQPSVSIEETREGEGNPVESGDVVVINYSLALAAAPTTVVEKGKGFDFTVAAGTHCAKLLSPNLDLLCSLTQIHSPPCGLGDVIKGMDAGVKGMKLGARRKIQVPWSLGYGKRGSKPDIPPEADLIFNIELVAHTST